MSYIESSKIKVFPAAGRGDDYPEGFLTTEDNLSNVFRSLYSRNNSSFVISKDPLKFVIMGYVFEITDASSLSLDGDLYAAVYLRNDLETGSYKRLVTGDNKDILDVDGSFKGVLFSNEKPTTNVEDCTLHTLQLLENGEIPLKSKFAYPTDEVAYFEGDNPETLTTALEKCVDEISAETQTTDTGKTLVITVTKYPK